MKLLLALLFIVSSFSADVESISYGKFVSIKEAPYFISLLNDGMKYDCGGVIISAYWVLTASHCIRDGIPKKIIAGSTINNKLKDNWIYNITKIFIPGNCENVGYSLMSNDIALLKLESPIEFNEFKQPIKIRQTPPQHGDILTVTGMGLQGDAKGKPPVLKQKDIAVTKQTDCDHIFLPFIGKSDSVFCAYDPNGGQCSGDSGGPAVIDGQLAGMVSFGYPCKNYRDDDRLPEAYTRVHKFYNWIVKITGINE